MLGNIGLLLSVRAISCFSKQPNFPLYLSLFPGNLGSEILAKGGGGSAGQVQLVEKEPRPPSTQLQSKAKETGPSNWNAEAGGRGAGGRGGGRQGGEDRRTGAPPCSACGARSPLPGSAWEAVGSEGWRNPVETSRFTILFLMTVIYFSRFYPRCLKCL